MLSRWVQPLPDSYGQRTSSRNRVRASPTKGVDSRGSKDVTCLTACHTKNNDQHCINEFLDYIDMVNCTAHVLFQVRAVCRCLLLHLLYAWRTSQTSVLVDSIGGHRKFEEQDNIEMLVGSHVRLELVDDEANFRDGCVRYFWLTTLCLITGFACARVHFETDGDSGQHPPLGYELDCG